MNKDTYTKIMNWIRIRQRVADAIIGGNKILTSLVYVSFIMCISWMLINRDNTGIKIIIVTGIPFILLSILRKVIARKRPYEKYGIEPIIPRGKLGDSFPSRHIFSAFVIATTLGTVNVYLGIILGIVGLGVAVLRVIGGVHFISDVLAGMIIGIFSGIVGSIIVGI